LILWGFYMAKVSCRPNGGLFLLSLIVLTITVVAQTQLGNGPTIQGFVRSKQVPLPGAIVTVVDATGAKTTTAVTEVNGQYTLRVAAPGSYHVSVELTPFTSVESDVTVADAQTPVRKDFDLALPAAGQNAAAVGSAAPSTPGNRGFQIFQNAGVRGAVPAPPQPENRQPDQNPFADLQNPGVALLPGMTPDAATESVAIAGNTAAPSFSGAFDPRRLDLSNIPGDFGGPGGFGDQGLGGQAQAQRGGFGGAGGPDAGPAGPGGRGGFAGDGGRGGFGGPGAQTLPRYWQPPLAEADCPEAPADFSAAVDQADRAATQFNWAANAAGTPTRSM
jgi:hypothetical protein